jgi:hypothetical protein
MVEIGRVRVKAGNAPIEQKISAYLPQADIKRPSAFQSSGEDRRAFAHTVPVDPAREFRRADAGRFNAVTGYHRRAASCARIKHLFT